MKRHVLILIFFLLFTGVAAAHDGALEVRVDDGSILFQPQVEYDSLDLRISGPDGFLVRQADPFFRAADQKGHPLPDGQYVWEMRLAPTLSDAEKDARAVMREQNRAEIDRLTADQTIVVAGAFRVIGGQILAGSVIEPHSGEGSPNILTPKDEVVADDQIVRGRACIGFDCVEDEIFFEYDALRLKQNNLRITIEDTSNPLDFPSADWRFAFNDVAQGGVNRFSIEDLDNVRTPFTLETGAPTHSLYVDDVGNLGLGTSAPSAEAHILDGDAPTLRLEQDTSAGFTPQTWDVVGDETHFAVVDVTGGAQESLRILPGAPSNSLTIDGDGNIGIGTDEPSQELHLQNDAITVIRMNNTNANNVASDKSWDIAALNNGNFILTDPSDGNAEMILTPTGNLTLSSSTDPMTLTLSTNLGSAQSWVIRSFEGGNLTFASSGTGVTAFALEPNGNVTFAGTVTDASDVRMKENISEIDTQAVLRKVVDLPITAWNYKHTPSANHLGPMAQDFYAAFGLGGTETGVQSRNMASVALAAIQGLHGTVEELQETVGRKDAAIETLEDRIAALEALVEKLASED